MTTLASGHIPPQSVVTAVTPLLPILPRSVSVYRAALLVILWQYNSESPIKHAVVCSKILEFFALRSTMDCSQEVFTTRLWLEAVRQGLLRASPVVWFSDDGRGGYGASLRSASLTTLRVFWTFYHAVQHLWKGAAA